jgi:hypothetical protein
VHTSPSSGPEPSHSEGDERDQGHHGGHHGGHHHPRTQPPPSSDGASGERPVVYDD